MSADCITGALLHRACLGGHDRIFFLVFQEDTGVFLIHPNLQCHLVTDFHGEVPGSKVEVLGVNLSRFEAFLLGEAGVDEQPQLCLPVPGLLAPQLIVFPDREEVQDLVLGDLPDEAVVLRCLGGCTRRRTSRSRDSRFRVGI